MADRAGYSIQADRLPHGTDDDFERGMVTVPQPTGFFLLAGMVIVGISLGVYVGTVPWDATDALTICLVLLSTWLMSVCGGALAGGGRMTHLGLFLSLSASVVSATELTRSLSPAMSIFAANGEHAWVFALSFLVALPIVASPLSIRRMRETLWQDVNWSLMDSICYAVGIARGAWVLSHAGNLTHDRYASVKTVTTYLTPGEEIRTDFFMVDKMKGRTAHTGDDHENAEHALADLGYDIEHIEDTSGTIRAHEYGWSTVASAGHASHVAFMAPPARGISAAEYYHRL